MAPNPGVNHGLFIGHGTEYYMFHFSQNFLGYVIFIAPEKKSRHHFFEDIPGCFISLCYGFCKPAVKYRPGTKEFGIQEFHLGPQLSHVVFKRCTCQAQPVFRPQQPHCFGNLGAGIFDHLAFIQNDIIELQIFKNLYITSYKTIGGNYQISLV